MKKLARLLLLFQSSSISFLPKLKLIISLVVKILLNISSIFVPLLLCLPRALELFVESLLTKAVQITSAKNAKTLSPAHL